MRLLPIMLLCSILCGCLSKPAPWSPDWGFGGVEEVLEDRRSGDGLPGEVVLPGDTDIESPPEVVGELPVDLVAELPPDVPADQVETELVADVPDVADVADWMDVAGEVDQLAVDLEDTESELPVDLMEEIEPDVCEPQCEGKECGEDGCGGLCAECEEGEYCIEGTCRPDYCLEGLGDIGCCLYGVLVWCGDVGLDWTDCDGMGCGWADGAYDCGFQQADPSEQYPHQCCQGICEDKVCGPDGCWGTCGECTGFQEKCQNGQCVCVPDCEGKECGDDGCGEECGECPDDGNQCTDSVCEAGTCQHQINDTNACEDEDPATVTMCQFGECVCVPQCFGKSCGEDGCTGICGACNDDGNECTDTVCDDGVCTHVNDDTNECDDDIGGNVTQCSDGECVCVPQCSDIECGNDTCGGSCGQCEEYEECQAGQCLCAPNCEGKECGDDECGGNCGLCSGFDGYLCVDAMCVCGVPPEIEDAVIDSKKSEGDYQYAYGAAHGTDEGYVVVGRAYKTSLNEDMAIWRHDSNGDHVYGKQNTGKFDEGRVVIVTATGTYMVGGTSSKTDDPPDLDCRISRIHETNQTLAWDEHHGGVKNEECFDMAELPAGKGFVLVGYSKSYTNGGKDMWLLKTSAAGEMTSHYHHGGTDDEEARGIALLDDGFAIAGWTASGGSHQAWILKMSPLGVLEWEQSLGAGMAYDVVAASDGGLVVVGAAPSESGEDVDAWAWKVDASGLPMWDSNLLAGSGDDWLYSVAAHSAGGYVAAGRKETAAAGESDGLLIRFAESGVKHWDSWYGGSHMDELWTVFIEPEGNITFAGTFDKGDETKQEEMWLVKLGLECGD